MTANPLVKKTKTELLEEYNKLLAKHEELRHTAQLVSDPQSVALLSKAEGYTGEQLTQSIAELKSGVHATLNELADKLITEAQRLGELQKSIGLAKKNLELHYHIQVAADTLDLLMRDYKDKTVALEEEIAAKKRDWVREQEEYGYAIKVRSRHSQEEFEETKIKQERAHKEREEAIKRQEQEVAQWREQSQGFSAQLEKALVQREQEVTKRFRAEFDAQIASAKKDWEAQKNLGEIQIAHLEERIKAQQSENAVLRQELEKANKRVQELESKLLRGAGERRNVKKTRER